MGWLGEGDREIRPRAPGVCGLRRLRSTGRTRKKLGVGRRPRQGRTKRFEPETRYVTCPLPSVRARPEINASKCHRLCKAGDPATT
jgi:hypothetical protein